MSSASVTLDPGDTLVLYTDGAIEARGGDAMLGTAGLMASLERTGGVLTYDLTALVLHASR